MRNMLAGLTALAVGAIPAVALDGPGRAVVVATTLQISSDPILAGNPGTSITRSFIVPYSGTVRVRWEARSKDGTDVSVGVSVSHLSSCEKTITSTDYVLTTCDIRVAAGAPISINAFPSDAQNKAFLRHVRLYYKVVNFDGKPIPYVPMNNA